jgi:adenine deaminase
MVLGLAEMMNYPGVINGEPKVLAKLALADEDRGQIVDGHSPWISGNALNAYAAGGIRTDHECATVDEMRERLRLGLYVQIREGSACRDLMQLIAGVTEANERRCLFCTDDKHPEDIEARGHIDNCVRMAIAAGVPPITAIRMATLNVAECYGLKHIGALAPTYRAHILLVDSLEELRPSHVFYDGKLVAANGEALFEAESFKDERVYGSVRIAPYQAGDLRIPLRGSRAHVIGIRPHSVETDHLIENVGVKDGCFSFADSPGIHKIAVFERHGVSGNIGLGLIKGFGLKDGAIASTVAHDSHNLIVIGDNDDDMLAAVAEIEAIQGGVTLVSSGKVMVSLPLPIAGLMSEGSVEEVTATVEEMRGKAYRMGVGKDIEPMMTLAFMALPVIPALKMTDRGLFDVEAFNFVEVDAEPPPIQQQ